MKVKITCESMVVLPDSLFIEVGNEWLTNNIVITTLGSEWKHADLLECLADHIRNQANSIKKELEKSTA